MTNYSKEFIIDKDTTIEDIEYCEVIAGHPIILSKEQMDKMSEANRNEYFEYYLYSTYLDEREHFESNIDSDAFEFFKTYMLTSLRTVPNFTGTTAKWIIGIPHDIDGETLIEGFKILSSEYDHDKFMENIKKGGWGEWEFSVYTANEEMDTMEWYDMKDLILYQGYRSDEYREEETPSFYISYMSFTDFHEMTFA